MTEENFEGLTDGIRRYVMSQVSDLLLLYEKLAGRVGTVEEKTENADRRSHYMEGRVDELKEQLHLVETQMKTYHGEVMTEIKGVVDTFKPLSFLSEHAADFQSMVLGHKKSKSLWGFVGKTALGAAVVALVGGLLAVLFAGLIQKMQPPAERTVYTQRTESYERKPDGTHRPDNDTGQ